MKKNIFRSRSVLYPKTIANCALALILLHTGCPMLTSLETPVIDSRPEYPDKFAVGNSRQVDLGLTIMEESDTMGNLRPIHVGSAVPLIEGKIKWILIDKRLEFSLNGGSSGLGVAIKGLILTKPLDLGMKFSLTGLPYVIGSFPTGCYSLDIMAGKKLTQKNRIFGGFKLTSWLDASRTYPGDRVPYFDAAGGFVGTRISDISFEVGVFKIFEQLYNYWGKNGFIPVLGFSVPFSE